MVAEDRDRGRLDLDLRRVEQLDLAPRGLRRLQPRGELAERGVHLRRGDALLALRIHEQHGLEHLRHALPRERRREEERHELEERRLLARVLLEFLRRLVGLLFLDVPLVHDDDQPAAVLPRERRDLEILILESLAPRRA